MMTQLKKIALFSLLAGIFSFTAADEDTDVYYVFSDFWKHGVPSGFMGEKNGTSMKIESACKVSPYKGENCVKITTDNSENWRGLHIQYTGAWNVSLKDDAKLPDLSAFDKLEFYARTDEKNEDGMYLLQTIGVGGGGAPEDKVEDGYLEIGTEWKKFSVSLKGHDFKRVNTLLYMVLPVGTLYLDEIRFVKKIKN